DPSEILGDDGAAASAELRYNRLPQWQRLRFQPFGFYDIGKVWNIATGGKEMSGASLGAGMRITHDSGVSGEIYGAFPMTRPSSDPLSGNGKSMRLLMQVGWRF
ncbi:MAG TPA: ShlB/FhaC/HecB family hemolysin secretion/activation protein, partial [Candidatus Saccharimonadales bacterium]|nr:ShlB/FhaC/HecB family hemolysin secretion/activation protein [Candidatus Saccharimonadales bacterium]